MFNRKTKYYEVILNRSCVIGNWSYQA